MTSFHVRDAEWVFRAMLRDAGIDPQAPRSVRAVWVVFKDFAKRPSTATGPDADGVLYECGTSRGSAGEDFFLDFVRQFEVVEDDEEHAYYEQLRCEFTFPVDDVTKRAGSYERWWFAGDSEEEWDVFTSLIESREEFAHLADVAPAAVSIERDVV